MLSHEAVWQAIDALAELKGLSTSGLARKAGLDPTSFNRSKRFTPAGRPRWPSTESIAKALRATETSLDGFFDLVEGKGKRRRGVSYRTKPARQVPLLGFAQAGVGGFFDDGGFPAGQGWDEVPFPGDGREPVYALEVSGDSMEPLYRDGDIIIVSPSSQVRHGDRVVVRTLDGEVMAKQMGRKTQKTISLLSLNPDHPERELALNDVDWIARILWASQ
jgi:phage repressor protein C with HTH and peptisase S24 domain